MTSIDHLDPTPLRRRIPRRVDLATAGAAATCAVIVWFFVAVLPGVELVVGSGGGTRTVTGVAVAVSSAAAALIGMVGLRVLERLTDRALELWTLVVMLVALVSLVGPLGARTAAAGWALVSLHAVVTAVVLAAGHRSRR